jgi:hypothetical protein
MWFRCSALWARATPTCRPDGTQLDAVRLMQLDAR